MIMSVSNVKIAFNASVQNQSFENKKSPYILEMLGEKSFSKLEIVLFKKKKYHLVHLIKLLTLIEWHEASYQKASLN